MSTYLAVQYDDSSGTKEIVSETFERDIETIIRNLEAGATIDYYLLQYSGPLLIVNAVPVVLSAAARDPGPATEIAVAQAGGSDVGTAIVEA